MITVDEFARAARCPLGTAKRWHPEIVLAMKRWNINTRIRAAGFIAQTAMESRGYTRLEENMNYSVQGLANTWPDRFAVNPQAKIKFPNEKAWKLGRIEGKQYCNQKAVAMEVYGSRYGNRPGTTDGWDYRGRSPVMLTFYDNYLACGLAIGLDLIALPGLLLTPSNGAQASGWYWSTRGCNELMDAGDYEAVTKKIQGGLRGYEDRLEFLINAKKALGIS